jgi:hypothetical protein
MNKSLDKKETTYRKAKERKSTENCKKVTGFLKNTVNQKDNGINQETTCTSSPSSPWRRGSRNSISS